MGNRCTIIFLRTLAREVYDSQTHKFMYVGQLMTQNIVLAMPSICMKRMGQLMAQPPQLPDVIPIENICHKLKEHL